LVLKCLIGYLTEDGTAIGWANSASVSWSSIGWSNGVSDWVSSVGWGSDGMSNWVSNGLGNNSWGLTVNDGVESVDWISGVGNGTDGTIGLNKGVLSLDDISVAGFVGRLGVSGKTIGNGVSVVVLWMWVIWLRGDGNSLSDWSMGIGYWTSSISDWTGSITDWGSWGGSGHGGKTKDSKKLIHFGRFLGGSTNSKI